MTPSDVRDLIAKLEAAREGAEELDAAIMDVATGEHGWLSYGDAMGMMDRHPYDGSPLGPPRLTRSLDAALSLVPEGCGWMLGSGAVAMATSLSRFDAALPWVRLQRWGEEISARAATPALALCIAALRARFPEETPDAQ